MRVGGNFKRCAGQLLALSAKKTMPKGAVLFRRGEPAFGVFLVIKGRVSLRLEGQHGAVLWERTVTPDSIIGLPGTLVGGRHSLTAQTLEETELAFVKGRPR